MPEGHTLHRMARDHTGWFKGSQVRVASPQGTFPGAALLDGQAFVKADAYGKHLFHHYADGSTVHVHLGLFGKFLIPASSAVRPRDTVRYRLSTAERCIDLVGATACALVTEDEHDDIVARLGPDPLRRGADPDRAFAALQRRSVGIGRALMDQKVLAGVGNVYRAEILFVHGVHPDVPAAEIDRDTWQSMWDTLVRWMRRGVREQRIVTVDRHEIAIPRGRVPDRLARYVYKREHCLRCGTAIRRWDLAGRWAYACETCQPPTRVG